METLDFIETKYALGDEGAKRIPPWTSTARYPPLSFIRTELAVEFFSPERTRRFVRLRRRQVSKAVAQKGRRGGMLWL